MLDRLRTAITSQPWRTAAVAIGAALAVSLVSLVLATVDDGTSSGETASTTSSTLADSDESATNSTAGPSPSTTLNSSTTTSASVEIDRPLLLGVRIDNAPPARPQWGLNEAQLIIEYPVEGGITRFTAIYRSGLFGMTGPVRSLRPVDGDLMANLTDVLATSGGQAFVVRDVAATGVELVVAQLSSLFPSVGNPDPYDTFVDLGLLGDFVSGRPEGSAGLPHGEIPEGDPADSVVLPFDNVSFDFESSTGYTRLDGTHAFSVLDLGGENLSPLTHDTLVVLFAAERPAGYADVNGVPVVTYDVIGSGRLLVFHDGQVVEGTWSRSAQEDPFFFKGTDDDEFGLPEGKTYMAIVPRGLHVEYR